MLYSSNRIRPSVQFSEVVAATDIIRVFSGINRVGCFRVTDVSGNMSVRIIGAMVMELMLGAEMVSETSEIFN